MSKRVIFLRKVVWWGPMSWIITKHKNNFGVMKQTFASWPTEWVKVFYGRNLFVLTQMDAGFLNPVKNKYFLTPFARMTRWSDNHTTVLLSNNSLQF